METIKTKTFNKRAFIAIVMCISGIVLPISGIMNHLLQMELLTQTRHFWMSIHNMSGLIFLIFTIFHIALNWKAIVNYAAKVKTYAITKEFITAILLATLLVGLAALHTLHTDI